MFLSLARGHTHTLGKQCPLRQSFTQGALPAPVMLQPQGNFTGAGNVSGPGSFPCAGKVAGHHRCRLSDGTRPNRQPATTAATAVTADGKHTARATSPMPSAGLTPPTPSGVSPPSSSSHPRQQCPPPLTRNTVGGGGGEGGIDHPHHAGTPQPHHPGHHHTHQHAPGRHHDTGTSRPLQARMTCAARTPPPGATGANLSALQPTPKPAHTPTTDRPSESPTCTHSRTAATITTNHHSTSHHDTPKPATTTKHQHTKTRAQPQQRDQHTTL